MKKSYKSNVDFLNDLFKHLEGDIKGFKDEIKEDKALIKSTKKRPSAAKIRQHLRDDRKYYAKESREDKRLLQSKALKTKRKKK